MKKFKKLLSIATALTVLSLSFTACFNPAFYQLNQDVVSETSLVDGSINSIARYTVGSDEYIFLAGGTSLSANKGLLYKKIDSSSEKHGEWNVYPASYLPFTLHYYSYYDDQNHVGEQIIKVLADKQYLYLVTAKYMNNINLGTNSPSRINIWAAQITDFTTNPTWTNIIDDNGNPAKRNDGILYCPLYDNNTTGVTGSASNVFSTNSPIQSNRAVYLRSGNGAAFTNKYYKLDGSKLTATTSELPSFTCFDGLDNAPATKNASDLASINYNSVVNVNGTEIFLPSVASCTNETYSTAGTKYYTAYSTYIIYGTESAKPTSSVNVSAPIASLAYCNDVLMIGRGNFSSTTATSDGGIDKVKLTGDVPGTSLDSFKTNAKSQLLSSYIVQTLLCTTPDESELDATFYASLDFVGTASSTQATFKNIGLWSYYPTRGNWNKE